MKKKIIICLTVFLLLAVAVTAFIFLKDKSQISVYLDGKEFSVSLSKSKDKEDVYISAEEIFSLAGIWYEKSGDKIVAKGKETLEINTQNGEVKVGGENLPYDCKVVSDEIMISPYLAGEIIGGEVAMGNNEIYIFKTVPVKVNFREKGKELEFDYSDSLFAPSSKEYNHALAKISIGSAVSAFSTKESDKFWGDDGDFNREGNIVEFYEDIGFSNIKTYNYDKSLNDKSDKVAFAIAQKDVKLAEKKYTLVAVSVRGGAYGNEWVSNFNLGDGEIHKGFLLAANELSETLYEYLKGKSGDIKLWITGFSRGGAVANIAAAKIGDEGKIAGDNIYAYTFATPRGTMAEDAKDKKYGYIYNVISENDLIPLIAPKQWGYERYGNDINFPSMSEYDATTAKAEAERINEIYKQISKAGEFNLIEIEESNQREQVKATIDSICIAMGSRENYIKNYQNIMMDFVECGNTKIKGTNGKWKWPTAEEGLISRYKTAGRELFAKAAENEFLRNITAGLGETGKQLLTLGAVCLNYQKDPQTVIVDEFGLGNLATIASVFTSAANDAATISKAHFSESYVAQLVETGNPAYLKNE